MLSVYTGVGFLRKEPKRYYSKKGTEISTFTLLIKTDDDKNNYDALNFMAVGKVAAFINTNVHVGTVLSVIARPKKNWYVKKDGTKVEGITFIIKSVQTICKTEKLRLDRFGGSIFPEYPDIDYEAWEN